MDHKGALTDGRAPAHALALAISHVGLAPGSDGLVHSTDGLAFSPAVVVSPAATTPAFSAGVSSPPPENQLASESATGAAHGSAASVTVYNAFDGMGLKDKIVRGIYGHGFEKPSAIQKTAIVLMAQGRDTIA